MPHAGPNEELLKLRLLAVECYILSGKLIEPAVALFNSRCPKHGKSTPSRFIREAWQLLELTFSLHTQHNQGRPRKVTDTEAAAAVQWLWAGYEAEGEQRYYTSIEAACELSPKLAACVAAHDIKPRTLLAAMRRVEPKCRRQLTVVKRPHSPENRKQRVRCCEQLEGWSLSRLQRTCWIDAATIWLVPKNMKVFAPPGVHLVLTDSRHPTHSSKIRKLRFYICVNALLGPVALRFITGTTDLEGNYMVGASACLNCWGITEQPAAAASCHPPLRWVGGRIENKTCCWLSAALLDGCLHMSWPAGHICPVQAQQAAAVVAHSAVKSAVPLKLPACCLTPAAADFCMLLPINLNHEIVLLQDKIHWLLCQMQCPVLLHTGQPCGRQLLKNLCRLPLKPAQSPALIAVPPAPKCCLLILYGCLDLNPCFALATVQVEVGLSCAAPAARRWQAAVRVLAPACRNCCW